MGGAVSSVVQAATNVVNTTVDTVRDVASTIVEHPLQGVAKLAEAPIQLTLDQASGAAAGIPGIEKVPVVGDISRGASAASRSLDNIEKGILPTRSDLKDVTIAGGALAGAAFLGVPPVAGAFAGDSLGKAAFAANAGDFLTAAIGAVGSEGFNFGAFLEGIPQPKSGPAPKPGTITVHAPPKTVSTPFGDITAGGDLDFATIAVIVGLGALGILILKGRK